MTDVIKPRSSSRYWIYVLSLEMWNVYRRYGGMYISCYFDHEIKRHDVIFLYITNRKDSGFYGMVHVRRDLKENDKNINIFRDKNYNNFVIKCRTVSLFEHPIKLKSIMYDIRLDIVGYTNTKSFTSIHINANHRITNILYNGDKLLSALYRITSEHTVNKIRKDEDRVDSEPPSDMSESSNSSVLSSDSSSSILSIDTGSSVSSDIYSESSIDTDDIDSNIESGAIISNGRIPIMIVPCKKFIWPKKNKREYFQKHYTTCNRCDVTNNNNMDISSLFLDNVKITITSEDTYLEHTLNAYYECAPYTPHAYKKKALIIITCIKDDPTYDGCLLVTWAPKKQKIDLNTL